MFLFWTILRVILFLSLNLSHLQFFLKTVLQLFVIYDWHQHDLNFLFLVWSASVWITATDKTHRCFSEVVGSCSGSGGSVLDRSLTWCSYQGHCHSRCYTWTAPSAASPWWASAPGRYPEPPRPASKHHKTTGGAPFSPCFYPQPHSLFTRGGHCKQHHYLALISSYLRPASRSDYCQEYGPIGLKSVCSWPMTFNSVFWANTEVFFV